MEGNERPPLAYRENSIQVESIFLMHFLMSKQLFSLVNAKNMCFKKSISTWVKSALLFGNLFRKKSVKWWFFEIFCFRKVSQHFLNNIENTTNKDTRRTNSLNPMFHHLTEDMERDIFLRKSRQNSPLWFCCLVNLVDWSSGGGGRSFPSIYHRCASFDSLWNISVVPWESELEAVILSN